MKLHHYDQMMGYLTRRQKFSNGGDAILPQPNPLSPQERNQKVFNDYVGRMKKYLGSGVNMPEWFVKDLIFQKADELGIELKAGGGRIGFEEGLLVSSLTPQELVNAQSAARKKGITGKKGSKEFSDFVGNGYTRQATKTSQFKAKKALEAAHTTKSLELSEINKLATSDAPVKLEFKQRTKLLDSYHKFFEEAYHERVKSGQAFGKSDLVRDVIEKIELEYPKQKNNLEFFPGKTKDIADKGKIQVYLEYISPKHNSSKFRKTNSLANTLSTSQMDVFEGNVAKGLKKTKQQEKIFNALKKGINEIDDLVKETGMTKSRINQETAKLVNNMFVRSGEKTPIFLQGAEAQNAIGDVYNSLVDSKTMSGFHTRNIKSMIYDTFPNDAKLRQIATDKVNEFTAFMKGVKEKFPGLKINYDHPGSYRALKNLNFKNFLNVTPIMEDINLFKSRFDMQSVKNLNAMADAKAAHGINSIQYKAALKNQRGLERVWSNMTDGQSTLGKLRLNRQLTGTAGLETTGKNLIDEFKGNIKIRENIAKNIDESIRFHDPKSNTSKTIFQSLEEVLPTKRGKTKIIESAKRITSPELLKIDKEISKFLNADDQAKLSNTIRTIINKQNSGFNVVDIGKWGAGELRILDDIAGKIPSKALGAFGKVLKVAGIASIPVDALEVVKAKSKGLGTDVGLMNLAQIYTNLPGMVWEGGRWVKSQLQGKDHEWKLPYEHTYGKEYETKKLRETPVKELEENISNLPLSEGYLEKKIGIVPEDLKVIDAETKEALINQMREEKAIADQAPDKETIVDETEEIEKPEKFGIYADQIKNLEV